MRLAGIGRLFGAVLALILAPVFLGHAGDALAQQRSLSFQGTTRDYILHLPKNAPPGPRPLVIALHGALQPAAILQRYLDLDAVADREGFVVAYPKGVNLIWNDGRSTVAGFLPILDARDDAGFVLALREKLVADGLADPGRTYLMGFSNGGFLTAFIACRHAGSFAAFATMMMTVPVGYSETCRPSRPVPIFMMNGTYDPIVPMFGRPTPGARLMSARQSVELFARLDGCAPGTLSQAPNTRILRFEDCAEGVSVAYYEIAGGHQPPAQSVGAGDALAALVLGPRRSGVDAPSEIWSFFKRYGTPALPVARAPGEPPLPAAASAYAATAPAAAGRQIAPKPIATKPIANRQNAPAPVAASAPLPLRPSGARPPAAQPVAATALAKLPPRMPTEVPLPVASPLRRSSASAE